MGLGKIGVTLDAETLNLTRERDRGTALRMLYTIKQAVGGAPKDKAIKPGLGGSNARTKGHRIDKKGFDEEHSRFMDGPMKKVSTRHPNSRYEIHNKKFGVAQTKQERWAVLDHVEELEQIQVNRDVRREFMLEAMEQQRKYFKEVDIELHKSWQRENFRRAQFLQKQLDFEHETQARAQAKIGNVRKIHEDDLDGGIEWFEANLQRIGIDTSENAGNPVPSEHLSGKERISEAQMRGHLAEYLPHRDDLMMEAAVYMDKVIKNRAAGERARAERDRRLRKQRVEQAMTQETVDKEMRQAALLKSVREHAKKSRKQGQALVHDELHAHADLQQKAQCHIKMDKEWMEDAVQRIDVLHEYHKTNSQEREQQYQEQKVVFQKAQKQRDVNR